MTLNTLNLHFFKNAASAKLRKAAAVIAGRKPATFPLGTETPIQTFYDGKLFDPFQMRTGLRPLAGIPPSGLPPHQCDLRSVSLANSTISFIVDPKRSFFGDCINVVDVPLEARLDSSLPPFGWSGKPLLGGYAMTASVLSGAITCDFRSQHGNMLAFHLNHGAGLTGRDSALYAPDGYFLKTVANAVRDAEPASRGKLDLASGQIHDFHYNVIFWNSAIEKLIAENPGLSPPPLLFPGLPHAGHAMAWITVNPVSRRIELGIAAEVFLPLGYGVKDAPLMLPASETAESLQTPSAARNSSLHPFIFVTAIGPELPAFRPPATTVTPSAAAPAKYLDSRDALPRAKDLRRLEGKTVHLTCLPTDTNFGDDFALRSERLGGTAMAQSPLFGQLTVQFGKCVDDNMPFVVKFDTPSPAFRGKFAELLSVLPPGTRAGLVGMCGKMNFPKVAFVQRELSLNSDPYNLSVGVVDVETGRSAPLVARKYLFQNVMKSLLKVEPRTPTDSFAYLSVVDFLRVESGGVILRLTGEVFIPYPENYAFPLPDGRITRIQEGSYLRPFVNLFAVETEELVAALPNMSFQSHSHVRGLIDSPVSVSIRSDEAHNIHVDISCGARAFQGRQCRARSVKVGDASVWFLEFTLTGRGMRDVDCYCVLTDRTETAELQMITADESFDLWVSGSCKP